MYETEEDIFLSPTFPILDEEQGHMCCKLIGCAIGCDFWEGCQSKIGACTVIKWWQSIHLENATASRQ